MRTILKRCPSLVLVLVLMGCQGVIVPDLGRLYATGREQQRTPPVILIPGILGSRLVDSSAQQEIWPGSAFNLVFDAKENLALRIDPKTLEPMDDAVQPDGLFEQAFNSDFYGAILRTLRESGGFVAGRPGTPADPRQRRYYVFAYDWRQDNVRTARKLDALIEQIRRDYGDPQLKVNIIAHSMGGLVTRYYLRYGTVDALEGEGSFPINMQGAAKVGTVVLLGTPNLGSVRSLHSMVLGEELALSRVQPEVLATMPSVYELLPHPLNDWSVSPAGKDLDLDLFDPATWQRFHWSVYSPAARERIRARYQDPAQAEAYLATLQAYFVRSLERARRFIWSITFEEPGSPVKLVVFGGDCVLTPARIVVEQDGDEAQARLFPGEVRHPAAGADYSRLMLEPGDGEVTKPSLLARESLNPVAPRSDALFFPLAFSFFLCEDHQRLTGNINFQDNLLNVLLSREHAWDGPAAVPPAH